MAEAYLHIPVVCHTVRSVLKKRLLTVHLACFKEDVEISAQRSRVLKNLIREIHLACLLCVTKVRNVQAKLKDLTGEILWPDPSGSAHLIPGSANPCNIQIASDQRLCQPLCSGAPASSS